MEDERGPIGPDLTKESAEGDRETVDAALRHQERQRAERDAVGGVRQGIASRPMSPERREGGQLPEG